MEYTLGFRFILNVAFYSLFDSYGLVKDLPLDPLPKQQWHSSTWLT